MHKKDVAAAVGCLLNDPGTLPLPVLSPQSLVFLGCVAAAGLGLNLLALAVYLSCLCCCRKDEEEEESKKPGSCCVTWSAVAAALLTWLESGLRNSSSAVAYPCANVSCRV